MKPKELKKLIRERMAGEGNYITGSIDERRTLLKSAQPGDTLALHPKGGGSPTLYEVHRDRSLRKLGGPDHE